MERLYKGKIAAQGAVPLTECEKAVVGTKKCGCKPKKSVPNAGMCLEVEDRVAVAELPKDSEQRVSGIWAVVVREPRITQRMFHGQEDFHGRADVLTELYLDTDT